MLLAFEMRASAEADATRRERTFEEGGGGAAGGFPPGGWHEEGKGLIEGRRALSSDQCPAVEVAGCEGVSSFAMGLYKRQGTCGGMPMYYFAGAEVFLFFSTTYNDWNIGSECGSITVGAYGNGGQEPFLNTNGWVCDDGSGGGYDF